jgi:hypothetical protein
MLIDKVLPDSWKGTGRQSIAHLVEMAIGIVILIFIIDATVVPGLAKYLWASLVYTGCWPRCGWPPF